MKKKKLFTLLKFCFIALLVIESEHLCKKATDGFTVYNITAPLPSTQHLFTSSQFNNSDDLNPIFDQPYTYLAKGAQCYAFLSKDGKYVIKFLKKKQFTEPEIYRYIPFYGKIHARKKAHKEKKIIQEFTSYCIALEKLPDETGLLYLHLQKTSHLKKKITLIDRLNIAHSIDLDTTEFIVQKKGDLVYATLNALREKNQIEEAKKMISSLCDLLQKRSQKEIADTDPNISKNFAFIDSTPIQIDIGRFSYASADQKTNLDSLNRMRNDFRGWLIQNCPELVDHFDREFSNLLEKGCF